jgi:hypothetical protein
MGKIAYTQDGILGMKLVPFRIIFRKVRAKLELKIVKNYFQNGTEIIIKVPGWSGKRGS